MAVFDNLTEVVLFWCVAILTLSEYLAKGSGRKGMKRRRDGWYELYKHHVKGTPPGWLFGVVWTVLYALLCVSVYSFYKYSFSKMGPGYQIDVYTLLLFFNVVANKAWSFAFFDMASPVLSAFLILVILVTGFVLSFIMGLEGFYLELGLFLPYMVWCLYALYLNLFWIYVFYATDVKQFIEDLKNRDTSDLVYQQGGQYRQKSSANCKKKNQFR